MMAFRFDAQAPERIAGTHHDTGLARRRKVRTHRPVEKCDNGIDAAII
jgi:hypothetical protein